jgi:hypothetical protein
VDLAGIDRAIAKEPAYRSKAPRYCLLVFGPEAKTRVWLVHDGDTLYVDRNGNGDLTEEGERVGATDGFVRLDGATKAGVDREGTLMLKAQFRVGTLTERDGMTKHTLWVGAAADERDCDIVCAEVAGRYIQSTDVDFAFGARPATAPVVHLNGPLAVYPWAPRGAPAPLARGDGAGSLAVRIGTAGHGPDSEAWVNPFKGVPGDISPVADVEFPNRRPGGNPIKVRLPVMKRGVGNSLFFDDLTVPADAGAGKAKVTVHFADWKGVRVAPATFEVDVEPPQAGARP